MENEFTQPSDHLAQSVGSIKHFVSLNFYQICFSLYVSKFLIQNITCITLYVSTFSDKTHFADTCGLMKWFGFKSHFHSTRFTCYDV